MEIKTEVNRRIFDIHGNEVKEGTEVVFDFKGISVIGTYNGITKKGGLEFVNAITGKTFSMMPSSISDMIITDGAITWQSKE